jgi:hypothetical protein
MIRTPLKRTVGLRRGTLRLVSKKQSLRLKNWREVTEERRTLLRQKFGYLPCECCGEGIVNEPGEGHHNDRNRANNTLKNCRILKHDHHDYVTHHNIRSVPDLLEGGAEAKGQDQQLMPGRGNLSLATLPRPGMRD